MFLGFTSLAQDRASQIKQMKIAFLTKELDLTVAEAEKFWPMYNQLEKDRLSLRKRGIEEKNNATARWSEITDKEADLLLQEYLKLKEAETQLEAKYIEDFKKFLASKKVLRLFAAERKFQQMLLNRLGNRANERNAIGE